MNSLFFGLLLLASTLSMPSTHAQTAAESAGCRAIFNRPALPVVMNASSFADLRSYVRYEYARFSVDFALASGRSVQSQVDRSDAFVLQRRGNSITATQYLGEGNPPFIITFKVEADLILANEPMTVLTASVLTFGGLTELLDYPAGSGQKFFIE